MSCQIKCVCHSRKTESKVPLFSPGEPYLLKRALGLSVISPSVVLRRESGFRRIAIDQVGQGSAAHSSTFAASLNDKPTSSRISSRMNAPGCGGTIATVAGCAEVMKLNASDGHSAAMLGGHFIPLCRWGPLFYRASKSYAATPLRWRTYSARIRAIVSGSRDISVRSIGCHAARPPLFRSATEIPFLIGAKNLRCLTVCP